MTSRYYDKDKLKSQITIEQVFSLLEDWGAEPEYNNKGLVCQTICHNKPGEGSRKLYYYQNEEMGIFHCYSNCGSMDIFELCIKVMKTQYNCDWELYDAMDYVARYFNLGGIASQNAKPQLKDWEIFKRHDLTLKPIVDKVQLREYNPIVLTKFKYPHIMNWEKEGITYDVCKKNLIGYYPGGEQITIPHYDIDGRLIGIRGRSLVEEEANKYGKYRPLLIGKTLYSHPLSMNLYYLNKSKRNIEKAKTAIVAEGEKTTLKLSSWFGEENNISVACCGQNVSQYQFQLLLECGAREVIFAFDRESNAESKDRLIKKLYELNNRFKNYCKISFLYDKTGFLLDYKDSPVDKTKETFLYLLKNRIYP